MRNLPAVEEFEGHTCECPGNKTGPFSREGELACLLLTSVAGGTSSCLSAGCLAWLGLRLCFCSWETQ